MTTDLIYFLPIISGISLFVVGRYLKEVTIVTFSGLVLFFTGVSMLITPIESFTSLLNTALGCVFWGVGGYIMIRNYMEYYNSTGA